jgi:ribosomal protein L29
MPSWEEAERMIAKLQADLAEARAQIAASEQEHQDFRLQNDAEWRAKLDHLKAELAEARAQIAAKDTALQDALKKLELIRHIVTEGK